MKKEDVGKALTRLRESRGWTPAQLAEHCENLSGKQISTFEKTNSPRMDSLGRVLDGLQANLCDLHYAMVDPEWRLAPLPATAKGEGVLAPPSLLQDRQSVGKAFELLRQRAGLLQKTVAERADFTLQRVSNLEKGAMVRLHTLEVMLEALDADLLDFHEALLVAHFYHAWKDQELDGTGRLCGGLVAVGAQRLGYRAESDAAHDLRGLSRQLHKSVS